MKTHVLVASTVTLLLSACTYHVQTVGTPQLDVYSNYSQKVPGKWAIAIDDSKLQKEVHSQDYTCAANVFPIDLRSSFRSSAISTFQNIVENVEVLDRPVPIQDLQRRGFTGEIFLRGEDLRSHLTYDPGWWSTKADSRVELDVGLVVDGANGRLVGTRATGKGDAVHDAGMFCGGTPDALADASQAAMKDVLGTLGERFTNAPQVRSAAQPVAASH